MDELTDCRKDDEALVNRGDVKEERRAEIGSETKIDQPMEGVEMSALVTDTPVLLPSSSEANQQLHVIAKFFIENTAFQIFIRAFLLLLLLSLLLLLTTYRKENVCIRFGQREELHFFSLAIPTASAVEATTFYPVVQTDFSSFKVSPNSTHRCVRVST